MFSRFAIYFDEVVRSGSIRRASEKLNISPSAIDRHMLLMEEKLDVRLFERLPTGLRLTAAGEVLITHIRRWRRDMDRALAQIDELTGLRRGEVSIAVAEAAVEMVGEALSAFRSAYPGIDLNVTVGDFKTVGQSVAAGEVDLALVFNPPEGAGLRVERTMVFQLGAVVAPGHPLADLAEVSFAECADHGLLLPDETLAYRAVIETLWARTMGGRVRGGVNANSIRLLKALAMAGQGVALLTQLNVADDTAQGRLRFIPLSESNVPLSVLSLVSAAGRIMSTPASLLLNHLAQGMRDSGVGGVG